MGFLKGFESRVQSLGLGRKGVARRVCGGIVLAKLA